MIKILLDELLNTDREISVLNSKKNSIKENINKHLIDLLDYMAKEDMFKMIFVTNDETITDIIKVPNIHTRSDGVNLHYLYMGEGDYQAITVEIINNYVHFNYFNSCNHRDCGYFFKLPIDVMDDYTQILPHVEKVFEEKYKKLQLKREHDKQQQIQELENRLNRLKETI